MRPFQVFRWKYYIEFSRRKNSVKSILRRSLSRFISMVTSQYRKTEPELWGNGEKWRCGVWRRGGRGPEIKWAGILDFARGEDLCYPSLDIDVMSEWLRLMAPLLAPALARLRWYWSRNLSQLSSPCRRHVLPLATAPRYGHNIYLAAKKESKFL